jgi:aryl-alcohol dehydrogenase-like predicted oxidoreductase
MKTVPRGALGTANFNSGYGLLPTGQIDPQGLLDTFKNCNGQWIDTAHHYGPAEEQVGLFLRTQTVTHDRFAVVSKFLPQNWRSEAELSVQRLGGHLRYLLWHNYNASQEELLEKLRPEIASFASAHNIAIGASTYGASGVEAAISTDFFEAIELEYNCLNPWALKASKKFTGQIFIRSALQKGFLTSTFWHSPRAVHQNAGSNEKLNLVGRTLLELANSISISLEELALRYVASTTSKEVILFGADNNDQVEQNMKWLGGEHLTSSLIAQVQSITSALEPSDTDIRQWK